MGNCICSKMRERGEHQTNSSVRDEYQTASIIDGSVLATDGETDDNTSIGSQGRAPDISFERESIVSKLENIYIEGDTCAICSYTYDEDEHLPRILPCGHTLCYYCIRKISRKNKFKYLNCPLDRQCHRIKQRRAARSISNSEESDTLSGITLSAFSLSSRLELITDERDETVDSFEQIHSESSSTRASVGRSDDVSLLPALPHLLLQNLRSSKNARHRTADDTYPESQRDETHQHYDTGGTEAETGSTEAETGDSDSDVNAALNVMPFRTRHLRSVHSIHTPNRIDRNQGCKQIRAFFHKENTVNSISWIDHSDIKNDENVCHARIRGTKHDIYDDERSVRSFEWVEPDYSSSAESDY